ncbi:MAG: RNA polymerase sigma factor [Bacteroidota bacterium]
MKNHPSPNYSENEIVALLIERDIKGMDILYDQYGDFIFGLISKIISLDDLAEIALQDTFLKVWNKIDSFSTEKGRFLTWMMNIARNTAVDMTRSKNYKQTMKLISLESVPTNTRIIDANVQFEHVDIRDIVARLDNRYCKIIELIYFEGYTHEEVAKKLNMPLGTVKGRVRKAFKDLRLIFES